MLSFFIEVERVPEFGKYGKQKMLMNVKDIVCIMPADYEDEYRVKQSCTYVSLVDKTCCRIVQTYEDTKEMLLKTNDRN